MIKHTLSLFFALLAIHPAAAQERYLPLEKWDYTAYCSFEELHPMQIVAADNNWQLLWELRTAGTRKELEARGIPFTRSQLMLLETQRLVSVTDDGKLKTAVPILDSAAMVRLRRAAAATADDMMGGLKPDFRSFVGVLDRAGFGRNAFSILFSHVLDGTIWDEFERRKVVDPMDGDSDVWGGCLWFYYPKSVAFRPGTNTLSWDDRHTLWVNWAHDDPAFTERIYSDDAERFFSRMCAGERPDSAAAAVAQELGLYDGKRMTVPVIGQKGALAREIGRLTRSLCDAFLRHTDLARVRETADCPSASDAAVIFYHEVMWQLGERLRAEGIVRLPHLFADPAHASPADMAAVCFLTKE